ncbi:MAG: DUF1015 domain-containing protein [Desulfobacterales bacterium]|nr:DUF1015 domain-containing protein [Desulfobacterales bacterium]
MAHIIPFRGTLYNPDKIKNFSDVVTPPYDVISKEEQQNFYKRHPYNIIRLILGKTTESDTDTNNRYTRAAQQFNQWFSEGILLQDQTPSMYLTSVDFSIEDKKITRYGLIAAVGLEPFEKGIILPHEKTFSKIKSERFELIKACHANFSSIFSLYSDQKGILDALKHKAFNYEPAIDLFDQSGHRHKLWRITDTDLHHYVTESMKTENLFIADGHHRYETALNYRNWIADNNPSFSSDHPANHTMMYLCSMEDPGLIIMPAHRMLKKVDDSTLAAFIQKSLEYFNIVTTPFKGKGREKAQEEFIALLKSNASKKSIGVFIKNHPEFYLLTLKPNVMEQMFGEELQESLRELDVTVLTRLIFLEILDFDQARLDNEKLIAYSSSELEAIDSVASGKFDITFILNSTKIEQVRNVAKAKLVMPRKSTYFYPKVITGQVLNKLT